MNHNTMKSTLDRLAQALKMIAEFDSAAEHSTSFPPASEASISAAEKRAGFTFPPSYRDFLKLSNGYRGINGGDILVLGASGPANTQSEGQLKRNIAMFEKSFKREGPEYVAQLKQREKTDSQVLYMPNHVPVATNFNGDWWVFDRNRARDGENEIAMVSNGEYVDQRWKDFGSFLQDTLKRLEDELAEHRTTASVSKEPSRTPAAKKRPSVKSKPASKPTKKSAPRKRKTRK